eukprot:9341672-Pyramimonas_sp.AAC.1
MNYHIDVNVGKLAIWEPTISQRSDNLTDIPTDAWKWGIKILGTPFGTDAYVEAFGARLTCEREKLLQCIPKLPSLQAAWVMLYFYAVPRINHLLRTLPPHLARIATTSHDH